MSRAGSTTATTSAALTGLWTLRVAVTALTALFVVQAATGGQYLVGTEGAMELHAPGAIAVHVLAGLQTLAAGLLWLRANAASWPTLLSVAAFGLSFLQAAIGSGDTLGWHVPLAMALLIAVVVVMSWAWAPGRARQ